MDNFLLLPRVFASTVSDSAFAIAFGSTVACLCLNTEDRALRSRLRTVTLSCLIVLIFAVDAQMLLQTATMIGSADLSSVRSQASTVLTETHAGRALLSELCWTFLPLILLLTRFGRQARAGAWSTLTLLVFLAGIRSATGHASSDGDFTLPEFLQFIHLVSTAIWSGCVIVAGLVVLPALIQDRAHEMTSFTRRLSRAVTVALALIVLSGLYNSYRGLGGSIAPLTRTQWGEVLDLKLVLIAVALTLGTLNRRMLRGDGSLSSRECTRLATIVRVEAGVMLLILTVSAWLANSPPANSL